MIVFRELWQTNEAREKRNQFCGRHPVDAVADHVKRC